MVCLYIPEIGEKRYDKTDTVINSGSINGNQFEGTAAKSGDYTIRVYMMRNAARRGETADYRLEMIVGNLSGAMGFLKSKTE